MFEGQFNKRELVQPGESTVLRRLRWTDLVARLSATRDLREELSRTGDTGFGCFGTLCREAAGDGKRSANHDALGHRKTGPVRSGQAANDAHGDREN